MSSSGLSEKVSEEFVESALKLHTKLLWTPSTKTKIELVEETMGKPSPFQTLAAFNGLMKASKGIAAAADWVLDAVLDGIQCGFYEVNDYHPWISSYEKGGVDPTYDIGTRPLPG
eukprot:s4215_g1.t1